MLPVGRIAGHRGRHGELTVRVAAGDAASWCGVERLWIELPTGAGGFRAVRASRAYRDRLVLRLAAVDSATEAAALRGALVAAAPEDAPLLPEGSYYRSRLVGFEVRDEGGRLLGRVRDVLPTGGVDLLEVLPEGARPEAAALLIPLAKAFLLEVAEEARRIRVRLPEGLETLNTGG